MNELGTHIKIFRKVIDNDLFCEKPFDRWHAFEWLLVKARYYPKDIVIRGRKYHLDTGQLLISTNKLADIFGWSRGKLLRFFETLNATGTATADGTADGTLITIENYSKYQIGQTTDDTTDSTADDTADGTYKNKDKEREIKNKKEKDKKEKSIDQLITELPIGLQGVFKEFVEMRKSIKAPVKTQRQFTLLANKLQDLSGGDTEKGKRIIEQSIMNGWKSLYEVKETKKPISFMDAAEELKRLGYGN